MQNKPLIRQLFPSYLVVAIISLVVVGWYASRTLSDFYINQIVSGLESKARLIETQMPEGFQTGGYDRVDALCKQLGSAGDMRVTVILPSGLVIGDSQVDPATMDNHSNRPEIIRAMSRKDGVGIATRYSGTLGLRMKYVAVAIKGDGQIKGVVRTSVPATVIEKALASMHMRIVKAGVIAAIAAAVLSLVFSRRISRPLEKMRRGAELFAGGDFTHKLREGGSLEISALAEAMNKMAEELDERIRTINSSRSEQQAVLSSMVESVIAVDRNFRCISINDAAARLVGTSVDKAQGKDLHEIVRNIDVQTFLERALDNDEPIEDLIMLHGTPENRYLNAHGTVLRDSRRNRIGAVVVMHDITQLRKLERIRRDFVANVSHELKTPVTSIKGFVDTLIDGAMNEPADAARFLEIISRQAGRLNAIINDLLTLSRLEQQTETVEIVLKRGLVKNSIVSAIGLCEMKSKEKGVTIELDCDASMEADIDESLLEQAIVNLIDNAIKYSEPGGAVQISAHAVDDELRISVRDHGCGIESRHLSRLFERFYRADKARSRKLGGTGLGLAIVKHIAQVHHGTVSAESAPGKGSTFTIHLPA